MMKKFLPILYILIPLSVFSQEKELKFGLKVFPSIAWNRVSPQNYTDGNGVKYSFSGDGAKFRGGLGIFADYHFTDNYVFTTGLNFLYNSSGYSVDSAGNTKNSTYAVQYLQLPIGLKLITNEVTDLIKVYVNLGITADIKLGASINGEKNYQVSPGSPVKSYSDNISLFASTFFFSPGIEYEFSGNTKLLLGFTYSRGLSNINTDDSGLDKRYNGFAIYNDYVALDLGVKF